MARRNIFSRRKHRLLRKQVPRAEAISSVLLAAGLVATTVWVFAQRDAYDPSVRDLPPELLSRDGPKIQLYNQPIKPWLEPGGPSAIAASPSFGLS
jgi:hypothetical protein